MTVVKALTKKPSFFYNGFRGFCSVTSQIFLIYILSIFLNKRNITTSLLMVNSKCNVVHYANLNYSSINKPYLWAVEYAISFFFFEFLFTFILKRFLSKNLWKTMIFNTNFKNSFQDVVSILQNIRMWNLVILK